jgi:ATP-binding cassette subfamily B protein
MPQIEQNVTANWRRDVAASRQLLSQPKPAAGCSVGNAVWHQALSRRSARARDGADRAWRAFGLVVALIAADSGLWRLAGLVARSAFVGVTGDLRRDIFRYLTGHARGYFAERPGGRRRRIDGLYRRG